MQRLNRILNVLFLFLLFATAISAQQKKKQQTATTEWQRTFIAEGVVKGDRLLSFEEAKLPESFSTEAPAVLSLSDRHFRDGRQSLRWDYTSGATFSLKGDLRFEPRDPSGVDKYLSACIVWLYNEKAVDGQVTFEFLKEGRLCCSFSVNMNFTGWRGTWICYERDMTGTPEIGMDELRVVAPDTQGTLYIDHLIPAAKVDARQQTADLQVPYVNKGNDNHWLVVYAHSLWKPEIELVPVTEADRTDMALLEERFRAQLFTPSALTVKEMEAIRKKVAAYDIKRHADGRITGRPIYFVRHAEAYERFLPEWDKDMFTQLGVEMANYFNLMKRVAIAYQNATDVADREELSRLFIDLYDNITDQGVAYGSCWGNVHHYGYSTRGLFVSYFLMKEVLRASGRLAAAESTLRWYAITNEVYPRPTVNGIDIDTFNTKLQGRVASILIMEDSPEKLQYMRSLQRWLEYACRPADGLMGSFKPDGACFHHCNNYPAYAVGGLDNATQMIYLLSGTRFALSELAHTTVKRVLMAMRFYCNLKQWPLSMSGRHPNGSGRLIPMHYASLALAGSPDGREKIDGEMARAYLRLMQYDAALAPDAPDYLPRSNRKEEQRLKALFEEQGFTPEPDPQGNLTLGYGCVAVQRRDNWAAVVRGHSRYIWAAEHYLPANFYGRYLAHGSMQLLAGQPGKEVTLAAGGWQEAGFDWNRIPGATGIHLPYDQLRARVLNVDTFSGMEEMLYSDEAFAGGLSQNATNGNFGMKLHEHDKYNGSHRARKSYHFLNGTIVCLGSDIENRNTDYPTETTVFQLANFSTTQPAEGSWLDPNGVGYVVAPTSLGDVQFAPLARQVSVGERSTKPTEGQWTSLTLQHGRAPKGAGYEYAILPRTDAEALKRFVSRPDYRVLQRDGNAHIVQSATKTLTSYVLFEPTVGRKLPGEGVLLQADTCCLVMTDAIEKGKQLCLTVCQPDLALYRGPSDEAFDAEGHRIERSIYSRPWIGNKSGEIPVTLTLRGSWQVDETPFCKVVSRTAKETVLRFTCRDAASFEVLLRK